MKVKLYYDEGCFDCVIAKTYLTAMNVDFKAKNLKDDKNNDLNSGIRWKFGG